MIAWTYFFFLARSGNMYFKVFAHITRWLVKDAKKKQIISNFVRWWYIFFITLNTLNLCNTVTVYYLNYYWQTVNYCNHKQVMAQYNEWKVKKKNETKTSYHKFKILLPTPWKMIASFFTLHPIWFLMEEYLRMMNEVQRNVIRPSEIWFRPRWR